MNEHQTATLPFLSMSKRAVASRENASLGGEARAARYEPLILSEWASKGGKAVLEKYGKEYFSEIPKRRAINRKSREARFARVKKIMRSRAARENGRKGGLSRAE